MKNIEKAIFITKVSQLKHVNGKYSRLYYGNEFCEKLLPSIKDFARILAYIKKRNLDFSLATPFVTEKGLKKIEALFRFLKKSKVSCEVIFNDWGIFNIINREYPNLMPVLGRLLTKQKRGPTVIKLLKRQPIAYIFRNFKDPSLRQLIFQKKLPVSLDCYYKGSNISSVPAIHRFLFSQRIKRIELDNIEQGLYLELSKDNICASVYLPYVYISTTFYCPSASCTHKNKPLLKIRACNKECQNFVFKLRHKSMPKIIFLKGNTQFYKNYKLPSGKLEAIGINRIVYEPEIPV